MLDWMTVAWTAAHSALFETLVQPLMQALDMLSWAEVAFDGVETVMLGMVQIALILLVLRPLESWRPAETWRDRKVARVDIVYTLLNKLGVIPLLLFVALTPIQGYVDETLRSFEFAPVLLEQRLPWLADQPVLTFLLYFVILDFVGYWVHRAQHGIRWWWALHSLHHSQTQLSCWSDDRNHILDNLITDLCMVAVAIAIGVEPGEFVALLLAGKFIESLSHANIRLPFGFLGERLIVSPAFHRLHHARANPAEPDLHDHNFGVVLPIWDLMFGTALYEDRTRPTGVDDPLVDADNRRGYLGQQIAGAQRFGAALLRALKISPGASHAQPR
jgi:sterol desaturase/sphingolipid hydroxylase (fatty acid hydroxylase superfamily)